MMKGLIQEEDIAIINIYAPNIGALRFIQQVLRDIRGEIDGNRIVGDENRIVGDVNTPLTSIDRASRLKFHKATENTKNDTIEKLRLH